MTEKKSEVSEVRAQLKDPALESDPAQKRTVLQRVIALMTTGVDVASLFPEIILACFTPDLVSKKLIYFFLTTHSERNAELAVLSINSFLRECNEESPPVRGLALRSLASLKGMPQLFDYLLPALKKALADPAPYVRKIAVLCTLTVFRSAPHTFILNGFYDRVAAMLRDVDPQVCANALEVLLEIADFDKKLEEEQEGRRERELESGGGGDGGGGADTSRRRAAPLSDGDSSYEPTQHTPFLISKPVLYHLLNHLNGLNEWQQMQIIDLIQQYTPATEEEMLDIMNVLEERLTGMHSGLVLSCSHAFIYLTQNYPAVHAQVLERLRQPLLMLLVCSPSVEAAYAVLCHVKLLVQRAPAVYAQSYKAFFCRHTEPSYMKAVKIDILAAIVDAHSSPAAVEELVANTEDRNLIVARKAIEALGRIALRLPETAKHILGKFLEFIGLGVERVRGATLVVMKDFLRKYRSRDVVRPFVSALVDAHRTAPFADEDSRVALVWSLGEFGELIEDAPYLLRALGGNLLEESAAFRLQMLTSAVTLFFKRPPEMQTFLGSVFDVLVNDFSNADVLDRAMMYYRLLREDPTTAAHVACTPKQTIEQGFAEDQDTGIVEKLFFEEFDTLSVVYGLPADKFTSTIGLSDDAEEEHSSVEDSDNSGGDGLDGGFMDAQGQLNFHPSAQNQQAMDLLGNRQGFTEDEDGAGGRGDGGLLNLLSSSAAATDPAGSGQQQPFSQPPQQQHSPSPQRQPLQLDKEVDITPEVYQRLWVELPTVSNSVLNVPASPNVDALVDGLESQAVLVLASSATAQGLRLYVYAQEKRGTTSSTAAVDALFGDMGGSSASQSAAPSATNPPLLFLAEVNVRGDSGTAKLTVKSRSANAKIFASLLGELVTRYCRS